MKDYDVLLFDLDHTLWDFASNSNKCIRIMYSEFGLDKKTRNFDRFEKVYLRENYRLWALYRSGKVSKSEVSLQRFERSLRQIGANVDMSEDMSIRYLDLLGQQTQLFPDTIEVLAGLKKNYRMALVTNGFDQVQRIKVDNSGLAPFFEHMVSSEQAGALKPRPDIFRLAMQKMNTTAEQCLMIGDSLQADVQGAARVGIDQVWFSPEGSEAGKATHMIRNLPQLFTVVGLKGQRG